MTHRLKPDLVALLKALRVSQPFNSVVTAAARSVLRRLGPIPEPIVKHLIRAGEVRCRLPDGQTARFWSLGDDGLVNDVFWRGWVGTEPDTAPVFYGLARRARVTLDVGAFVGYYSVVAGLANPSGAVYAFEPLAPIRSRLEHNLHRNGLRNVHVVPKAVGATSGVAEFFHIDPTTMPSSSSLSSEFMHEAVPSGLQKSAVEVVALDDFVRDRRIDHVDLLKVDTETTEADVLRGAQRTLSRERPDIVCEVLPFRDTGPRLEEVLGPLGYRYYHLRDAGPTPSRTISPELRNRNYLFRARPGEP